MTEYLVTWRIDIEADSPREAAERARYFQIKPDTTATVFSVFADGETTSTYIDLTENVEYEEETSENIKRQLELAESIRALDGSLEIRETDQPTRAVRDYAPELAELVLAFHRKSVTQ